MSGHREGNSMLSKSDNSNIIKRVYQSLKCSVIAQQFAAAERLNIEILAEDLRVSITPVRETLLRLVAEGLIINVPKMGFFMRTLSEADIRDLYEMNYILTTWSMDRLIRDEVPGLVLGMPELVALNKKLALAKLPSDEIIANASGAIFEYCARRSGNLEIVERVKNMNDRLNHTRVCESQMEQAPVEALLEITKQGVEGNYKGLQKLFDDQYQRSVMLLPHVMRQRILPVVALVEETLVNTCLSKSGLVLNKELNQELNQELRVEPRLPQVNVN